MLILNQLSWAAAVNKPLSWFSIPQGVGGTGQVPPCRDPAPAESSSELHVNPSDLSWAARCHTRHENFHMPELDVPLNPWHTPARAADGSVMRWRGTGTGARHLQSCYKPKMSDRNCSKVKEKGVWIINRRLEFNKLNLSEPNHAGNHPEVYFNVNICIVCMSLT